MPRESFSPIITAMSAGASNTSVSLGFGYIVAQYITSSGSNPTSRSSYLFHINAHLDLGSNEGLSKNTIKWLSGVEAGASILGQGSQRGIECSRFMQRLTWPFVRSTHQ